MPQSKQKEIFEELANRRMGEIWDLSKQVDYNNLIYHFKSKTVPNFFFIYERSTKILLNIKEGNITQENQKKNKKEIRKKGKNEISNTLKGKNKTGGQIHAKNNITHFMQKIYQMYLKLNTKKKKKKKDF